MKCDINGVLQTRDKKLDLTGFTLKVNIRDLILLCCFSGSVLCDSVNFIMHNQMH